LLIVSGFIVECLLVFCSEIEAKTRAVLGQTDINDMYDKEAVDTDITDADESDGLSEPEA